MLGVTVSTINVGGGVIFNITSPAGPLTLTRVDPTYSMTYTLLNGVTGTQLYIDMGDKSPQPLQSGVPYSYTISDTVTTLNFTVTLPTVPPIAASYDNMTYLLQRLAEATLANIAFPRSPSGADDPIKKASVYISTPMTENIIYPAVFINQELLKQEEIPVGAANQSQQIYFAGTTGLYRRVFSFTIVDTSAVSSNFYHDVLFALALSAMSNVFGNDTLQQSVHFDVQSTGGPQYDNKAMAPVFYISQILMTIKGPLNLIFNPPALGLTKAINVSINDGQIYPLTSKLVTNLSVSTN